MTRLVLIIILLFLVPVTIAVCTTAIDDLRSALCHNEVVSTQSVRERHVACLVTQGAVKHASLQLRWWLSRASSSWARCSAEVRRTRAISAVLHSSFCVRHRACVGAPALGNLGGG